MSRLLARLLAGTCALALTAAPVFAQTVDPVARGLALKAQTTANAALPKAGGTMTGPLVMSCASVATSIPCINVTQAWTTTSAKTLLFANVTSDATPNAAAKLIQLQYLSADAFRVLTSGEIDFGATSVAKIVPDVGGAGRMQFIVNGTNSFYLGEAGNGGAALAHLGWSTSPGIIGSDVYLERDAANTLAQRNGVNPQTDRWYNSFTDLSNGDYFAMDWQSLANVASIGTYNTGSYTTARNLRFMVGGVSKMDYGITNAGAWTAPTFIASTSLFVGSQTSAANAGDISVFTNNIGGAAGITVLNQASNANAKVQLSLGTSNASQQFLVNINSHTNTSGNGIDSATISNNGTPIYFSDTVKVPGLGSTGTIPTVTGTGSPTITSGSTDTAGEVTGGTLATSIVITFASAKTNAPFCTVTSQASVTGFSYTISTTAITISLSATTGEKVDYHCFQH